MRLGEPRNLLTFAQQQQRRTIRFEALFQQGVALFHCGTRDVSQRFLTAQADQQGLPRGETIEGDSGFDEGHRTHVARDVDFSVGGRNGVHDTCSPRIYKNKPLRNGHRTMYTIALIRDIRGHSMAESSSSQDPSSPPPSQPGVLSLTAQIVSAHVANNKVGVEELPGLIQQVYSALSGSSAATMAPQVRPSTPAERPKPAVAISKSVFNDYIVCLEDGKKLKMLKRHLQTAYGMTPEQYRTKWGLDSNYPMVAPEYAKKRSSLAKAIGLGTRPRDGKRG
jgi:predicted transcriptional regulator